MPWIPGHVLDRWTADLQEARARELAVTRELGEARAETERWRGQAEAQAAQVARMETELGAARHALQEAQRKGAEEDPWGHDEGEYRRILRGIETDEGLAQTLITEGGMERAHG